MSQFAFLAPDFPEVHALAVEAEGRARTDGRGACVYARISLEAVVGWLYRHERSLRSTYERTLSAHLHEPTFVALVGQALLAKARLIKDLGNRAAHEARAVPAKDGVTAVRELFHVAYWLGRTYGRRERPAPDAAFSVDALPVNAAVPAATLGQLREAARRFEEAVEARKVAEAAALANEEARARLAAELEAAQAEIAEIRAANARVADVHDYDEAATRDAYLDRLLEEAGWTFTKPGHDTERRVVGMPNAASEGFVDYVLWGADGRPLGLVEAKRTRRDAREGQQQAKLYADCLEAEFGQRPVIFYSNGYEHWIWDDTRYPPRQIGGFYKRDELELAI